ncbi:MAG: hypothetical protein ACT4PU_13145 [Planctomycetota bacterium]
MRYSVSVVLLVLALLPAEAFSQGGSREATWPAPTAEDWAKPCLIAWQRSFEDAVAVARESGRPLLVCVNMDGEIASEHYAGVRYRQPEIAALYEPYVCVIASVYRHTPRDYDDSGARVLCPRFGSVTCGEHIAIEPGLFEAFMDDERVAPRHIGVELDGSEMYDVFYAYTTEAIFDALRQGVANRPAPGAPEARGDLTLTQLLDSRDNRARSEVEAAYLRGDAATRRSLLEAVLASQQEVPLELLRLALAGSDPELIRLARQALARTSATAALELLVQALQAADPPLAPEERAVLLAALERLGGNSPRAATLAVAYRGLEERSQTVDIAGWERVLAAASATPRRSAESSGSSRRRTLVETVHADRLANQDEVLSSPDAEAHLGLAEAFLALAQAEPHRADARLLVLDAQHAAERAAELGASGPRLSAALAAVVFHLGDEEEARRQALAAAGALPDGPLDRESMIVLSLFAQARLEALAQAVQKGEEWPAHWLSDVHAAFSVLARHPFGTDTHVALHHDVLSWCGAKSAAHAALEQGLERFPASALLHDRQRARLLEQGVGALELYYEQALSAWRRTEPAERLGSLPHFAAQAALVAAEYHRRAGQPEAADQAYARAIAHLQVSVAAEERLRPQAEIGTALALAGQARLAFERNQDDDALTLLLSSLRLAPRSAATLDGLNVSAVETGKLLMARLTAAGRSEAADQLRAAFQALARLDPDLLLPPEYDRNQPGELRR